MKALMDLSQELVRPSTQFFSTSIPSASITVSSFFSLMLDSLRFSRMSSSF